VRDTEPLLEVLVLPAQSPDQETVLCARPNSGVRNNFRRAIRFSILRFHIDKAFLMDRWLIWSELRLSLLTQNVLYCLPLRFGDPHLTNSWLVNSSPNECRMKGQNNSNLTKPRRIDFRVSIDSKSHVHGLLDTAIRPDRFGVGSLRLDFGGA
jgi:hypothetical protein